MDPKIEARAKMIWGVDPGEIRDYLIERGFSEGESAEILDELLVERYKFIRRRGFKRIIIGGIVSLLSGSIVLGVLSGNIGISSGSSTRRTGGGLGVLGLVAIWGLWKFIDGFYDVLKPEKCSKSLSSDNDEF